MKILVDISAENYDRIVAQIEKESRLYAIMMNGVIVYDRESEKPRRVVKVFCEQSDAGIILDAAKNFCPEATAEIERSITLLRAL
jgi:hypothetical protein